MVKRGEGYFQNSGGSWLKGGVKKFRGVWTLDEAMRITDAMGRKKHHSGVWGRKNRSPRVLECT